MNNNKIYFVFPLLNTLSKPFQSWRPIVVVFVGELWRFLTCFLFGLKPEEDLSFSHSVLFRLLVSLLDLLVLPTLLL